VPPCGASQAETLHGGFNRSYQGYGGGLYGRSGGANRFHPRGRGFEANGMPQHGGFDGFRCPHAGGPPP
jgi:hypothetical protein